MSNPSGAACWAVCFVTLMCGPKPKPTQLPAEKMNICYILADGGQEILQKFVPLDMCLWMCLWI